MRIVISPPSPELFLQSHKLHANFLAADLSETLSCILAINGKDTYIHIIAKMAILSKQPKSLHKNFIMANSVLELASTLVQECLGFTSLSSKLNALNQIQLSLQSCFSAAAENDNVNNVSRCQEWQDFLNGSASSSTTDDNDDGFDDDNNNNDFMLRDSLIKCLIESCHPNESDTETDENVDDTENNVLNVIQSSLICLSYLVQLRCVDSDTEKKKTLPLFDGDFVTSIASDLVQALKLDNGVTELVNGSGSSGVSGAACELLTALLRSDRPRNEMCTSTIRDLVLLPACGGGGEGDNNNIKSVSIGSAACIAEILSKSIITAVEYTVPNKDGKMDEEEVSMRRETAALNRLQDMRDVLMNIGLVCTNCLSEEKNEICSQRILNALQDIYDIAAFAIESQLETLLDDKAAPIIERLSKKKKVNEEADSSMMMMDEDEEEGDEDMDEAALEEACTLPPIYATIAKPPAILTTMKNLESMLIAIETSLATKEAELWNERLDALIDLERILAGGVVNMSPEARYLFIEKLRKMNFSAQFTDLRSQITQQVCRVIIATAFEYREYVAEEAQLNQIMSQFIENNIGEVLNLCKSGTRLMATQGINCIMCLMSVCGNTGYARTIPRFCDEILGKKVHKNRKRGSVVALTVALRVWDPSCFVKHIDQLTKATKEGATNRDPEVREEGRKLYWAMHACEETTHAVQKMFDGRSREMKNLKKEKPMIDSEWEQGGIMSVLVETGMIGEASAPEKQPVKKKAAKPKPSRGLAPPRNSVKRSASSATARLRAQHETPFKAQRVSTPNKSASTAAKKRPPSSASSRTLTTSSTPKPAAAYSPMRFSESKKSVNRSSHVSSSKIPRSRLPSIAPVKSADNVTIEEKENSMTMTTPAKSVVGFKKNPATPVVGTPVVNLLACASPLSAERVRNTGDVLGEIIRMLSDKSSPHEQQLGISALALFAKENTNDPSWNERFSTVLACLLGKIHLYVSAHDFVVPSCSTI